MRISMKRLLFFVLFILLFADNLGAQIVPGLQYSDLKNIYYAREYKHIEGDPYSPALSAIGSFFIPGLGQFCCGERGRGLGMFAAGAAINAAMIFSAVSLYAGFGKDRLMMSSNTPLFCSTSAMAGSTRLPGSLLMRAQ